MSRSLIISLVASVVVGSAQAGYKEQALELGSSAMAKVAPYMTAKTAGIVAATGVVGYGLKKLTSAYCGSKEVKSVEQKQAEDVCAQITKGAQKNAATLKPSLISRMWAKCPSLKTVGKTAAVAVVAGAAYYFGKDKAVQYAQYLPKGFFALKQS